MGVDFAFIFIRSCGIRPRDRYAARVFDRFAINHAPPTSGKPIRKWKPEDDGWANVVADVQRAAEAFLKRKSHTPTRDGRVLFTELSAIGVHPYRRARKIRPT